MSADLIFLDCETTGLDPKLHQVWEVAWAVNGGPINVLQLPHDLANADPVALRLNGYLDRVKVGPVDVRLCGPSENHLARILRGSHVVGCNPAFDTAFLRERWGDAPWHHRLIDVSPMAMPRFGWDRPRGLEDIATALRDVGHDIPEPDHTAAGDVACVRAVYVALMDDTTTASAS